MLPPLVAGSIIAAVGLGLREFSPQNLGSVLGMLWLPLGWIILYGCAFHAAGFFMPRGMRLFGLGLHLGGCGLLALGIPDWLVPGCYAHGLMGFFFGLLHLAYAFIFYFTEQRKNEP